MNTASATIIPSDIQSLLDKQQYADVISLLQKNGDDYPSGQGDALLGLAHYQQEQYEAAAQHYESALKKDPGNEDWQHMLALSQQNALAELNVPVPDFVFFERDKLMAAPVVPEGSLPAAHLPKRRRGLIRWLVDLVSDLWGLIATVVVEIVTWIIGRFMGYRDEVWTNWYRRPFILGVLTLAHMRNKLSRENLKNTYPAGSLIGFVEGDLTPPPGVKHYRTVDGTWNNLKNPKEGAAGTRFLRNVNDDVAKAATAEDLMSPNPRELSRIFLTRGDKMKEVPFLNMLAASWIQFQNHDWINHGEVVMNDVIEIPLAEDDPARKRFWQTKMFVGKTQADPTRRNGQEKTPTTFINEVTHWWDGSQIYGSDLETANHLRSHVDGKLRVNEDSTLPLDGKGIEETGFVRNWWVGLTMLHNVFVLEHNAICDRLKIAYPHWDDNRLYNVARLINAAVMAKIHSIEWTPAVLPNRGLDSGLNANWYGLLTNLFKTGKDRETVSRINIRNPEMGGIVGNPIRKFGEPYGLTQEFVEVYRLHSFLPEELHLKRIGHEEVEMMPFVSSRQAGSRKITERMSMADLFYSFGTQHPGQLVLNNFPRFMQEMCIPGNPLFDMGAVDILRARERGVPRYNEFRRQLGLNPIRTFDDLNDDPQVVRKLKEVYGDKPGDVEKLDLLIGTLGESHRPDFFGFGETMFQIFILNASRRLQADRFYTTDYNASTYTREGLEWIDDASLKSVLLRHYPELARTGLANVTNAFEPWDTDEQLDPARHPLRAYSNDLKPDPWKGEAYK